MTLLPARGIEKTSRFASFFVSSHTTVIAMNPSIAPIFAAIDIGSNAARLLIKRLELPEVPGTDAPAQLRKVFFLRYPLRLGDDVFTPAGRISPQRQRKMLYMIKAIQISSCACMTPTTLPPAPPPPCVRPAMPTNCLNAFTGNRHPHPAHQRCGRGRHYLWQPRGLCRRTFPALRLC